MTFTLRQRRVTTWLARCAAVLWVGGTALFSSAAPPFQLALPGYHFQFPRDHASHPGYATEWWYYTGHLRAANGHSFGYELTFFRIALPPTGAHRTSHWAARDIILAHFALTDESGNHFYYTDRASRAALGLAGAGTATPHVWLGNWTVRFTGNRQSHNADGTDQGTTFGVTLTQQPGKPLVIHGENGVSQKSAGVGHSSHYYSFTRLRTTGSVRLAGQRYAVTGESWFDHEFGSNQMGPGQAGWDWFSIQLADGRELMLYHLRHTDGTTDPYSSGTLIERDGHARHLRLADFRIETLATWTSPHSHAAYPSRWRITLPHEALTLTIEPTIADQELITQRSTGVTYWEGSVHVTGTQRGRALSGAGYVELTGYAKAFNRTF